MPDIGLKTAGRIEVVQSFIQHTFAPAEAITPGQAGRIDTGNGKATKANASNAAEARVFGISASSSARNTGVTLIRKGILDGFDLSGLAFDALIYLSNTDGALSTDPGTVNVVVGRVIPGFASPIGSGPDKLLLVDL